MSEIKIGKVLSALMGKQRYSLKALSKATGVPASTLGEWVNNRTPKNPVHTQKVAQHLGVSMHFLLFGEEDRQEPITKIMTEDFFKGTFEISIKRVKID
ncbi:MAG: helix-turn-helix domain-containing protein [Bdellovibrionales bacterium]|nr:helix-turn-helix domain-containing protein [Bdellovibrionales bacterium]